MRSDAPATRVLLVDDHLLVRRGVRALLADADGFDVVGEASDGDEALVLVKELQPDLVVLDAEMPRRGGLDVLHELRRAVPRARVVMFTLDADVETRALALGASAFLLKDASAATIIGTLRRVADRPTPLVARPSALGRELRLPPPARWPRAPFVIAAIQLLYAVVFVVTEPALGAGAGALSVLPVALTGVLLGPELGLLSALLTVMVSTVLWAASGHVIGEPILHIGGGLGLVVLLGLGAGFGAMREIGGRLDRHGRRVRAITEVARSLAGVATTEHLSLVVDAALHLVPGRSALIYAPAGKEGALEVVAATGPLRALAGGRATLESDLIARALREGCTRVVADLEQLPRGSPFDGYRAAVLNPTGDVAGPAAAVLVVLHPQADVYTAEHIDALRPLTLFIAAALRPREAPMAAGAQELRPAG
jgi:CheY-like chemotaxis protein